jgi:hypothetical protein
MMYWGREQRQQAAAAAAPGQLQHLLLACSLPHGTYTRTPGAVVFNCPNSSFANSITLSCLPACRAFLPSFIPSQCQPTLLPQMAHSRPSPVLQQLPRLVCTTSPPSLHWVIAIAAHGPVGSSGGRTFPVCRSARCGPGRGDASWAQGAGVPQHMDTGRRAAVCGYGWWVNKQQRRQSVATAAAALAAVLHTQGQRGGPHLLSGVACLNCCMAAVLDLCMAEL